MITLIAAAALSALAGWSAHAACARQALDTARRDPLTGLPARAAWSGQASRMLRGRKARTVALIDLDRFKQVNDTYGHAAGDELLAVTAARLRSWAGRVGGGAAGRLGGDEFAVITCRPVSEAEAADLAAVLAGPVALPGHGDIPTAASVGITACAGRQGLSAGLAAADAAMYQAKRAGGGYRFASTAANRGPQPSPSARARHHGPPAPRPRSRPQRQRLPGKGPW
jgi:diguanylate cyclase (GGDEF)-like protein